MYLQRWHGWCHMKLLPSRRVLYTTHAPCHFMQSHILKVHACLAVKETPLVPANQRRQLPTVVFLLASAVMCGIVCYITFVVEKLDHVVVM